MEMHRESIGWAQEIFEAMTRSWGGGEKAGKKAVWKPIGPLQTYYEIATTQTR